MNSEGDYLLELLHTQDKQSEKLPASNSRARSLSDVGSGLKIQCSRVFAVASAQTAQTYKGSITTDMIGLPTFRLLVPP